jgi:hypothetical protein
VQALEQAAAQQSRAYAVIINQVRT